MPISNWSNMPGREAVLAMLQHSCAKGGLERPAVFADKAHQPAEATANIC
jgi:hypothetical protein